MTCLSLYIWQQGKSSPRHILTLGVILFLILLPMSALTSNDAERYIWDGAVFLHGFDPYVTSPNDNVVSDLRDHWKTPEEHASYATLYPPGALLLFALSAIAGPTYSFWVWKILATIAGILSLILAYDLLKRRNILKHLVLIALSPLLLLETGAAAHLDIFCVLGITAALWSFERDKIIMTGIIIGIAATIKFLPAVIAGPLLFYLAPYKSFKLFLSASLTWLLIYLAMFGLGYKPLGILPTFFENWRGGAPFYPFLESMKTALNISDNGFILLLTSLAVTGFVISAITAKRGYIIPALMVALATPLILSPVLFPWYLMAFIPLIALRPNATAIIALSLAPLSYVVLNDWLSQSIWQPASWPSILLMLGIIMGLIIDLTIKKDVPKSQT